MLEKPIVYASIPVFNQETQAVFQGDPIDMGDHIFVGVEVRNVDSNEGTVPEVDW